MNPTTEHDALTNMARGLNLTIHQYHESDRRKKTRRYFAQRGMETVSPTLDYTTLNHLLLGWRKANQQVLRLALGNFDMQVELGISCDENETELDTARFMMTLTSKLVSIAPPIDGVTQSTSDVDLIFAHAHKARRFGFGAKLCIHPKQIPVVKQAFTPTPQEVDWAQRVIAADKASGGQAAKVDGKMIDRPVVMLARRILSLAGNP